jgi:hypothetical protein
MLNAMAQYRFYTHSAGMPEILYYQYEKKELNPGLQARKSCRLNRPGIRGGQLV